MGRPAKLTPEQVQEIREDTVATLKLLADRHGCSIMTVWKVKHYVRPYEQRDETAPTDNAVEVASVCSDGQE